jgi:hypothetical protein
MTTTKVNLANTVEGILPVANGGTGTSTGVAPGGSTTQVQYNNAGAFGGDSGFVYTGGNVGIGTSSPGSRLDTAGDMRIRGDSADSTFTGAGNLAIKNSGGNSYISWHGNTGTRVGYLQVRDSAPTLFYNEVAQPFVFGTNSTERMRITSTGVMYLGPLATNFSFTNGSAVDISGSGTGLAGTATNLTLGVWNGPMVFQAGNNGSALTERMRIDSSGNVGIGTATPASQLEVKSAAFTDSIATINSTSTNVSQRLNFTANGTLQTQLYDDSTVTRLNAVTSKPLVFSTNNTERFRIGPSGQLGIGGATYGSSGQVLTSQGSGSAPVWAGVSGTVNAWVLWNGSAISSSVNVSSVTNPATGAYTINFTTAFSSGTSFAALALGQGGGGTTDGDCAIDTSSYPRNSGSSITIVRKRTDNNARENGAFNAAFIGT